MQGVSGFHTFRHSAASFMDARTGNLKFAQRLLGHSKIDMTADIYTHTSAKQKARPHSPWNGRFMAICSQLFPIGEQEQ